MSKFVINLKQDEFVPRKDLKETLQALIKGLGSKDIESVIFNLQSKPKKGKVQVSVIELPLQPINNKK